MSDPILQQINAISTPGTTAAQFLTKLGPIHFNWHHANNMGTLKTGFLLFHWELIQQFEAVGGPASFGGVVPYTPQQLATSNATFNINDVVNKGDINSLEKFSQDCEDWHNNAHMSIGMAVHVNLMNPKTNVKHVEFWRLHYFINQKFEQELGIYRSAPTVTIPSVVAQLVASPDAPRV